MDTINLTYSEFVDVVITAKNLRYQHTSMVDDGKIYYNLFAYDGPIKHFCKLNSADHSSNITDFQDNYEAGSNLPLEIRNPNTGLPQQESKVVNGTLYSPGIKFTTGDDTSLRQPPAPNNLWTIDTTTSGQTKVLFEPTFDYELDGGGVLYSSSAPANDTAVTVLLAPDTVYEHRFIDSIFIVQAEQTITILAQAKYIKYYPVPPYPTGYDLFNNLQIIIDHDPSDSLTFSFYIRTFI